MRAKSITEGNSATGIASIAPWRLTKVKPLPNYEIEVEFNDGTRGFVEMIKLIMGDHAGIFAVLENKDVFNQAHLEYGVLTWPGGIDLAPDAMHDAIKERGRWILQ